jgi:peptidyl-prolyl cis-trans isomerase D
MAIIGKIREKSVLLVIIIGLALLAFIFTDWNKGGGGNEDQIGYGTIGGEMVDFKKFEEAQNNFMQQDAQQAQQQQKPYTDKEQAASKDKAWSFIVESTIIEKEMDALGINVGKNEFDAYLYGRDGFPVLQEFQENFKDSATGLFNARLLQQRIEQMENSEKAEDQKAWEESKQYYIDRRKQEKYFTLLNQGVYATTVEAEDEYISKNEVKSISFVMRRFGDLRDEEIKVTDKDLKAYYEEHKNEKQYENKFASREVKFFDVSIAPSKKDVNDFSKVMNEIKTRFAATSNDSIFVMKESEEKRYMSGNFMTYMSANDPKAKGLTYPATMDSVFAKASVGQIVGPYQDGETMNIAKITGFNTNRLKVRHILLSAPKEDKDKVETVRKTADSLIALLNKDNFAEYVQRFSEDPGSKDKGGVYEDFMDYEMVPEFSKFATDMPIGTIGKVQTDFGWHIMENLDRTAVRYPVMAVVKRTLKASPETLASKEDEVYDLLYKMDARMKTKKDAKSKIEVFDTLASKAGYVARPIILNENKLVLYGFTTSFAEDKIIKLAFQEDVEAGTLCAAPIKDKDRYIIAVVSKVKEKGVPSFEDVEETMKIKLIEDIKAKRFMNSMKGAGSLASIAKKVGGTVEQGEVTFASPQMGGAGFEPDVVGAVFSGLKAGQKTLPIKGRSGVYVVRVDKVKKAPATKAYKEEQASLLASMRSTAGNLAKAALIEKADVVDNRRFLSIGMRR